MLNRNASSKEVAMIFFLYILNKFSWFLMTQVISTLLCIGHYTD